MDELPGSLGTSASLALRFGQTIFSTASLLFMCLDVEFYSYTAFCYLVTVMGLVVPWSMTLALSYLSLAAACTTASTTNLLLYLDGSYCPAKLCTRYQLSAAMAFLSWFLSLGSSLFNLWLLPSFCARNVFDDMSERSLVLWNSMISGYARSSSWEEAFLLFREMRDLGVEPDKFTLVTLLSVCSQACDLELGRYVHLFIEVSGIEVNQIVRNALLDIAYAKQGLIEFSEEFFNQMPQKNVVSWNSMISNYVREGQCRVPLDLFQKMLNSSVVPDEATLIPEKNVVSWDIIIQALALHAGGIWQTFIALLSACSQSGLLDFGRCYFEKMKSIYRISPEIEHYACMVDLLWIHGNVDLGKLILKQLLELERHGSGLYVLLANIFGEVHRWEDVKIIGKLIKDGGSIK
ncbi:unnamed protein product [Malus baccata var. baccata]